MENLKLEFPKVEGAALKELEKVRRALVARLRSARKAIVSGLGKVPDLILRLRAPPHFR